MSFSEGGGHVGWCRRLVSCVSLSAKCALRAVKRVGHRGAQGPWDRPGDSRHDAAGVVSTLWRSAVSGACGGKWTPSAAGRGGTCWGVGVSSPAQATLGGGARDRMGRWTGGGVITFFSLGPAVSTVSRAMTQQSTGSGVSVALALAASSKIA